MEDRAEPPREADNANFCEYLVPATANAGGGSATSSNSAATTRAKLDALFAQADSDDAEGKSD